MLLGMNMVQLELLIAVSGVLALYGAAQLLIRLAGERRALTGLGAVFLTSLVLICIGGELIEVFGVALRRTPLLILQVALGLSAVLLVMVWGERAARRQGRVFFRWAARGGIALLCAVMVIVFSAALLFTALDSTERVVEHQGQKLVERDIGFLDPHYQYHTYYGPVFRGSQVLYSGEQRLDY